MRLLVALIPVIAFCACSAIPTVPRDNSHYVEGASRYIWMSDEHNELHLVDLHETVDEEILSRHGANNEYWLFTRSNRNKPQIIRPGNADTIRNSNFVAQKPLKVVVHGWSGSGNSLVNTMITSAFIEAYDCNVIVVDWRALSNSNYLIAARGVPSVGEYLGNFLEWLVNTTGTRWNTVHLVGFSLGAHIVGNAGRYVGGKPIRVSGLDPAGPLWSSSSPNALNRYSGQYVEGIHTDIGIFGLIAPVGHADFYPNGGRNQPGCKTNQCSHSRVYDLFASSVLTNHFVGRLCTNLTQAVTDRCSGGNFKMGNGVLLKRGYGIFGLSTDASWPY